MVFILFWNLYIQKIYLFYFLYVESGKIFTEKYIKIKKIKVGKLNSEYLSREGYLNILKWITKNRI